MSRRHPIWLPLVIVACLALQGVLPVLAVSVPSVALAAETTPATPPAPAAPMEAVTPAATPQAGEPISPTATLAAPTETPSVTLTITPTATLPLSPTLTVTPTATLPVTSTEIITPTLTPEAPAGAVPAPEGQADLAATSLDLSLAADPAWAEPGDVVTFTAVAANLASASLPDLTLADTLPDGLVYVEQSAQGFEYEPKTGQLTWPAGDLAAGAAITGSFQARV